MVAGAATPPPPKGGPTIKYKVEQDEKIHLNRKSMFGGRGKKMAFVAFLVGLMLLAVGIAWPTIYKKVIEKDSVDDAWLEAYVQVTASGVFYDDYDRGNDIVIISKVLKVSDKLVELSIEGQRYSESSAVGAPVADVYVITLEGDINLVCKCSKKPAMTVNDEVKLTAKMGQIFQIRSDGVTYTQEIPMLDDSGWKVIYITPEQLGMAVIGFIMAISSLSLWMFKIYSPTKDEKSNIIKEQREKRVMQEIKAAHTTQQTKCPVCGIGMAFKPEANRYWCDICNTFR